MFKEHSHLLNKLDDLFKPSLGLSFSPIIFDPETNDPNFDLKHELIKLALSLKCFARMRKIESSKLFQKDGPHLIPLDELNQALNSDSERKEYVLLWGTLDELLKLRGACKC